MSTRLVVGCMTGTSLDGLDAALVRVHGHGLSMRVEYQRMVGADFPGDLAARLRRLAEGEPHPPLAFLEAARDLGRFHADTVAQLVADGPTPDFVCAHGQTIWHAPGASGGGVSWQLFDPWPLVRTLGVPVVYDLRQADLVAGGQGAPITPVTDPILYGSARGVVLNLGGICNATVWTSPTDIRGGDVGPCNLLLDGLCRELIGTPYDADGVMAAAGAADPERTAALLAALDVGQKSLGREQYGAAFVHALLADGPLASLTAPDALATAVEAVASRIASRVQVPAGAQVILAGGGVRNLALKAALTRAFAPAPVGEHPTLPAQAREAAAFAVLGALCQDGVPITLPAVTGAKNPGVAGVWAGLRSMN